MSVYIFLSLFCVNLLFVSLKSFQQKSVMMDKKLLIMPVSLMMSWCEMFMIGTVASLMLYANTWWSFIPAGLGATAGCLLGMEVFNRYAKKENL